MMVAQMLMPQVFMTEPPPQTAVFGTQVHDQVHIYHLEAHASRVQRTPQF